jgi:phage-related protein
MSTALAQGGLAASSVGFSIQETTGILAAFSNAGLEGSDAGTSLKTMLDRLVPSTDKARTAMQELGIITEGGRNKFLKANGEFQSATSIAETLQNSLAGLSSSERKRAINTIFGSDAQRAANILAREGAEGLVPLIKATSDQGAAQELASANMAGTAGAIERMKGALETAQLAWGQAIKPVTLFGAELVAVIAGGAVPLIQDFAVFLTDTLGNVTFSGGGMSGLTTAITAVVGVAQGLAGAFMPFVQAVLPSLVAAGQKIAGALLPGITAIANVIQSQFIPAFARILPIVAPIVSFLVGVFAGAVVGAIQGVVQAVTGIVTVISGVFNLIAAIVTGNWSAIWSSLGQIVSGAVNAVIGIIRAWLNIGIVNIFRSGAAAIVGSWRGLWTGVKAVGSAGANAVRGVISNVVGAIGRLFMAGVRGYVGLWRGLFQSIGALARAGMSTARAIISGVLGAIRGAVSGAMGAIRGAFTSAWNAIKGATSTAWSAIKTAVTRGISAVVTTLRGLPGKARSALSNLGGILVNAGSSLIGGLLSGITSKFQAVLDKVKGMAGAIKGAFGGSPVEWGPLKSWNNTGPTGPGGLLVGRLMSSIESQRGALRDTVASLASEVKVPDVGTSLATAPRVRVPQFAGVGAGAGAMTADRALVHIENQYTHDPRQAAYETRVAQSKAVTLARLP